MYSFTQVLCCIIFTFKTQAEKVSAKTPNSTTLLPSLQLFLVSSVASFL